MTTSARRAWAGLAGVVALMAGVSAAHAQGSPFDGDWSVTLTCPSSPAAHAMGFSFQFPAHVTGGLLHGERGRQGEPGWMTLDGPIAPDGSAALIAQGLTGMPSYVLSNVHAGTPFKHPVQARFTAASGTGSWTTIRTCDFAFSR